MKTRSIRPAAVNDLERIMNVLDAAREKMRQSGNANQWINGYPNPDAVISDIEHGGAFVVTDNDDIVAYFAFLPSPEPTYAKIYEGKWLDAMRPYHVVHRMGSLPTVHGIFNFVMDYCFSVDSNICVDTHRDNKVMQHLFESYGFQYCGIIYLLNGDERLAYQKIKMHNRNCR